MLPKIDFKMVKREIINFIKDLQDETDTDGIIIGLSGGLDSTVVAYLLKEAIGNENIYSYHLASSTTPKEDTEHARVVAKLLGISYNEINIDSISEEILNLTSTEFNLNKQVEGNLKARIRMSLLYYFANLKNSLVAGTSNKSELSIGYFTKFGDGACDFEPIGDIYKTQLKEFAKFLNITEEIINKPPRAGLWENQTDEEEIGFSYEILDQILYFIIDKKLANDDIINKMDISSSEIDIVRAKIANNEHKLHSPPSPFEGKKLF